MDRQTYNMIIIVMLCWGCFLAIKGVFLLKDVLTNYRRLRVTMSEPESSIRLINTAYMDGKKSMRTLMVSDIILILCFVLELYRYRTSILLFSVFLVLTITILLSFTKLIFEYRYAEDAYLEKDALVCIDGIYTKAEYTFSLFGQLSEEANGLQYVTVQSEKMKNPKQFKIIGRDDEVVQIIKTYYQ